MVKMSNMQMKVLISAISTESAANKTGCQVPCTYLIYRKSSKEFMNPVQSNTSGVHIGFSSMTLQVKEESLLYPPESLFGDIGGSLGLFLGFSLLSFGETAIDICKRMIKYLNACRGSSTNLRKKRGKY